jgi:hypothetical protein
MSAKRPGIRLSHPSMPKRLEAWNFVDRKRSKWSAYTFTSKQSEIRDFRVKGAILPIFKKWKATKYKKVEKYQRKASDSRSAAGKRAERETVPADAPPWGGSNPSQA